MRKKTVYLIPLLLIGLIFIFANSCNKDDDIPELTTTTVSNIISTTAISGGNITSDGGSEVSVRGVCWSTAQTPTIADNKTTDGTGIGAFSSNLSGLSTGTKYYVRAYATNVNGTGYGSAISFTTKLYESGGVFTDSRDNNVYKTVIVGNQEWMAEDLKYLPSVIGPSTSSPSISYYYVYDYDGTNIVDAKATAHYDAYGVLYNWPAAMNMAESSTANPSGVQGVCPSGWHLPSDAEWTELTKYLDGEEVAGDKLKETGTTHWNSPNENATNETGFTALPGGYRANSGTFLHIGQFGHWWGATEANANDAWSRFINYNSSSVDSYYGSQEVAYSVRCIKD